MFRIKNKQNVMAGLMFAAIAGGFLLMSHGMNAGTPLRMGPSFLPRGLSVILLCIAAFLIFTGVAREGADDQPTTPQRLLPLLVLPASIVIFALSLNRIGLVLTIVLTVVIASLANPKYRLLETLLLGAGLAALSALVFVYGLKLSLPLSPAF